MSTTLRMVIFMRSIGIAVVVASFAVACSNGSGGTPTPEPPVSASTATPGPNTWGKPAKLSDGVTITITQPTKAPEGITYRVTVDNGTDALVRQAIADELTIDGLPSDDAYSENEINDPGYSLGVPPHKSLTFTVRRTKVPPSAKSIAFAMHVSFSTGNSAIDTQYWAGDIEP